MICGYGCGREAKYLFKNGKWCCSENYQSCPFYKKKKSIQMKRSRKDPDSKFNSVSFKEKQINGIKDSWKDPTSGFNSNSCSKKISKIMTEVWKDNDSIYNSILYKEKQKISSKLTIRQIQKRYPFFSKIEEMRYNPNNSKEMQVRCINHNCKNSKEKGGWFTPTYTQIYERIRQLEKDYGNGGCYFYCSQKCKDECILFKMKSDPYKDTNKPYTQQELTTMNILVLKRDKEICYYCGEHANIVHHTRPQKLEPFFALDPDHAVSCCEKCHYKFGHPTGSKHSTGNLAKIVCSVESQKFLNQK